MLIRIEKIVPLPDARGDVYAFPFGERNHVSVIYRHAGTVSGNHYHPGVTRSKSPETFYLLSGQATITVHDRTTNQRETYDVEQHTFFAIPPNVHHTVTARTDIVLLEFNIAEEDFMSDVVKGAV